MPRSKLISGLFVLLLFVVGLRLWMQFGYPLLSKAQEGADDSSSSTGGGVSAPNGPGPHVAFFDSGNNIEIPKVLSGKTSNQFYITVMVGVTENPETIKQILGAAVGNGFLPIIRVTGVNLSTPRDAPGAVAQNLAQAIREANLPEKPIVVYGNELNNLDKEWQSCTSACPGGEGAAGNAYAVQFTSFKSNSGDVFTAVPAPPDMYNGVYSWEAFVSGAGCGVYSGQLVANVYETVGGGGAGLDLYRSLEQKCGGTVIAFTEYGPHPIKSLQEHVQFFLTNSPAVPATTLIPDKCDPSYQLGEDKWLYFLDGKLYDKTGAEIDPVNCDSALSLPPGDYYRRFVYPFFGGQNDTIESGPLAGKNKAMQLLVNDYDVTCSDPVEYEVGVSGDVNKLLDFSGCDSLVGSNGNSCLFEVDATSRVLAQGAGRLFGVLRNEQSAILRAYEDEQEGYTFRNRTFTNRFESIEQWFGANNPDERSYRDQTPAEISGLHQGPIYKLASDSMLCEAAGNVIKASEELCAEWGLGKYGDREGKECPLMIMPVRGSERKTIKTLGQNLKDFVGNQSPGAYGKFCELYDSPEYKESLSEDRLNQMEELRHDLANVDLYMERAYRPAFLVMVTEVDPLNPPIAVGSEQQRIMGQPQVSDQTTHLVDYLVYHVPSTLTDTDNGDEYPQNSGVFTDPVKMVAQVITSNAGPDSFQQQFEKEQEEYRGQVEVAVQQGGTEIKCAEPECDEPLRKTLIEFLNGMVTQQLNFAHTEAKRPITCKEPNDEKLEAGQTIGSRLEPVDEAPELANSKTTESDADIDVAGENIVLKQFFNRAGGIDVGRDPGPKSILFNISPHRANTEFVATGLQNLIAANHIEDTFTENENYFDTFEAVMGNTFQSSFDEKTYNEPVIDPATGLQEIGPDGLPVWKQSSVVAEARRKNESEPIGVRFEWMAKIFNFSTRAIVQNVSEAGTALRECAAEVKNGRFNTEDFLKGCQDGEAGTGEDTPPENEDYMNQAVAVRKPGCEGYTPGNGVTIQRSTNQCKIPNSIRKEYEFAALFSSNIDIPGWKNASDGGDAASLCTQAFYDRVACTYSPDGPGKTPFVNLIAHKVDANGVFTTTGSMTACEYVVQQAKARGVSPKLALAMWGEVSNFGSFSSPSGGEDFGVISQPSARESGSIKAQLDGFLGTINSHPDYLTFLRRYSGERDTGPDASLPNEFCNNPQFPYRLWDFYNDVQ